MNTILAAPTRTVLCHGARPSARHCCHQLRFASKGRVHSGTTTPTPDRKDPKAEHPFYFDAGYGCYAKRPSRPFPPPFLSPPSGSFSDPLSTHDRSRDRRPHVNGDMIRGITNGDDAVLAEKHFIGANDGVGAWAQKDRGHAALWSRLVLHFWALETDLEEALDPIGCLQRAFENTQRATTETKWDGTTTASGAHLYFDGDSPILYATNIGDSQIMVVRPSAKEQEQVIYKSEGQWHWFDCPYQLGTNSVDTPTKDAKVDKIDIQVGDVVLAMSDGVPDNLWDYEVAAKVVASMQEYERGAVNKSQDSPLSLMQFVAQEVVDRARYIAEDPYAESPYMERAIEEGVPAEGGKIDDISVVAAICRRKDG